MERLTNSARDPKFMYLLVVAGFLIRLIILLIAENRLDADEATVGIMALDILEGKAYPLFFYRTIYNGGGAIEAYFGAVIYKFFGPSEIALKICLLMLWAAAAFLFANLCKRTLSGNKALFSVLFFVVSTPFFLEWSIKARGGYAETVLFSVLLLWLADPPPIFQKKLNLQCISFGIACGIGIYASEMLLAMVVCAGLWLIVLREKEKRIRAVIMILTGGLIGLMPLIIYNVTHDFANFKVSVLYNIIMQERETIRVSIKHMLLTPAFVLGKSWILLLLCFIIASVRLIVSQNRWKLGHVVLLHSCIYFVAYWLSGDRYLSIPPTRTLYALYPGLAILFSYAIDLPRGERIIKRILSTGAIVIWICTVSFSVEEWVSSRVPREEGSWRGSWSLIDGEGLYNQLVTLNVEEVYSNPWTRTSLLFAARKARYNNTTRYPLQVNFRIPEEPEKTGKRVAIVLHSKGGLIQDVESLLHAKHISSQRYEFKQLTILAGLDSSLMHLGLGFPRAFGRADWKPMPTKPDGFN